MNRREVVDNYWLNYILATVELVAPYNTQHVIKSKFAALIIQKVSPANSLRITHTADTVIEQEIAFGFAIIPKFREVPENDA